MITFTDDHEAELWRSVYTSFAAPLAMEHTDCEPHEIAHDAGWHADAAVLEYRKRCGQPTECAPCLEFECTVHSIADGCEARRRAGIKTTLPPACGGCTGDKR